MKFINYLIPGLTITGRALLLYRVDEFITSRGILAKVSWKKDLITISLESYNMQEAFEIGVALERAKIAIVNP